MSKENFISIFSHNSKRNMKVVTSGSSYLDIDAYGGCIAYAELLNLLGYKAKAVSSAPLNESITPTIRSWCIKLDSYIPKLDDEFVLIDISNNNFIDPIVIEEKVIEVIDHHPGFEMYWQEKIGDKADIEFIGATCTQVYERWKAADLLAKMSHDSARLLATGILDNTLGFRANVTTERDRAAYEDLANITSLPADWPAQYFSECQMLVEANMEKAIKNDAKTMESTRHLPHVFGQLAIWDGRRILHHNRDLINEILQDKGEDWVLNLISISEGKSYFVALNILSQEKISKLLGVFFDDGIAVSNRLWLRKEIIKQAINRDIIIIGDIKDNT